MNKQITYLLSGLMVLFVLSSCITTGTGSEQTDTPNNETTNTGGNDESDGKKTGPSGVYKVDQKGTDLGSDMNIKIVSVQDSRCPTNTNCFVAGEAKIILEVTKGGKASNVTLKAKGNCEGDDGKCGNSTTAAGQKIQLLNLYPYPEGNDKIEQGNYTAKIQVN